MYYDLKKIFEVTTTTTLPEALLKNENKKIENIFEEGKIFSHFC